MSARSQDDADDLIPVGSLSGAELEYLRPQERRRETISRRVLTSRISSTQGETMRSLRESGETLHIRQTDEGRDWLQTTAVAESMAVTPDGLEKVSKP